MKPNKKNREKIYKKLTKAVKDLNKDYLKDPTKDFYQIRMEMGELAYDEDLDVVGFSVNNHYFRDIKRKKKTIKTVVDDYYDTLIGQFGYLFDI